MNVKTALEREVAEIVGEQIEVGHDKVAKALAHEIVSEHIEQLVSDDAIEAGVQAAIEGIDGATLAFAVDVIHDRVAAEVVGQAKAIALRMLRETAGNAERAAAACSPDGGL